MPTCPDMCRHVLTCADMCQHVKPLSAPLIPTIWTLSCMQACVSTFRHVLICANMCWHVPACANMLNHSPHLWYQRFELYLVCRHLSAHLDMPTCADVCRHVLTYSITFGTSDTKHLDLTSKLACVSTCRHADMCWCVPTCADMYQHVPSPSATLIPTMRTLSARWHVSAHVVMPTCADMCRHVLICADMWHHSWHLWYQSVGPYLQAGMCQHI